MIQVKSNLLNLIQVAAEVNATLRSLHGENNFVIVTKTDIGVNQPVYNIYAGKGGIVGDRDTFNLVEA